MTPPPAAKAVRGSRTGRLKTLAGFLAVPIARGLAEIGIIVLLAVPRSLSAMPGRHNSLPRLPGITLQCVPHIAPGFRTSRPSPLPGLRNGCKKRLWMPLCCSHDRKLGDHGDLKEEDGALNEAGVTHGNINQYCYNIPGARLYAIAGAHRSSPASCWPVITESRQAGKMPVRPREFGPRKTCFLPLNVLHSGAYSPKSSWLCPRAPLAIRASAQVTPKNC